MAASKTAAGAANTAGPATKAAPPVLTSRWSKVREAAFLEHLALSSNVSASERVARLTPGTAYRQRRKEPAFSLAWDVALREGYGRLELTMLDRAINGTPVTITLKDGTKKETIEYPERLQILLFNAHRAAVLGPAAAIEGGTARERLSARLAEMNRRLEAQGPAAGETGDGE